VTGAVHDSRGNSPQSDTQTSTPGPKPGPATPMVARTPHGDVEGVRAALGNRGFGNYVRTLSREPVQQAPPRPPAQSVTVYLVGPPPPIHAAVRATDRNRQLAELIDEIDKLSDTQVIERRRVEVLSAQSESGRNIPSHELALEAAEYVAGYRRLEPLKGYYGVDNADDRRRNARVVLEEGIREHHSFKDAFQQVSKDSGNDDARALFEAQEKTFRLEFKKQAYATAFGMLAGSRIEIEKVLRSYGIPVEVAMGAGGRLSRNGVLKDEVAQVLLEMEAKADVDTKAHVRARFDLAETVGALKKQKQLAEKLDHDAYLLAGNVGVTDEVMRLKREAVVEKTKFRQMWIQAEQRHPVLTAYRHGGDIFQVDLGDLDTGSVDDEMRAVLMHVLPKLGDMIEAHDKLRDGSMSPLSIPTVVAMTKTNMFIPKDSIRDGIANDMADEEGTESKWVILGAILLALVTFFPSGGASLGIVAGMASVGLATYSAVHEWEKYSKQKMLSDTNLDIAHSLATEEPSLTPFIFSLVALGLEPIALASAFNKARKLKALVNAGDDTSAAVVNELNVIGSKAGKPGLGEEALEDIRAEQQESKAAKASKVHTAAPAVQKVVFGFASRAEVRAKVAEEFLAIKGAVPERWELVKAALRQTDGKVNRELVWLVDGHMAALRDPEAWADVLADAWEIAAAMPKPDLRAALLELARMRGIKTQVIDKVLDGGEFFRKAVRKARGIIDPELSVGKGQALHGELTHLIQDLVVDHRLGTGASARFRTLLGKAEGRVQRWLPQAGRGATPVPTPFGAEDAATTNVTFLDNETSMPTGDYVWRSSYDLFYPSPAGRRLPQPEAVGPVLRWLFELK
jgi:hypothetical protein